MKLKFTGLILIAIGFAAPFALQKIYPTFMYASMVTILCFWIGFIAMLNPIEKYVILNPYLKWARTAVILNIVLSLFLAGYVYLYFYFESLQVTGYKTLRFLHFLNNPVEVIFSIFIPQPMIQQSDGTVLVTYSFARMLFTTFFSILAYSLFGIVLKLIKDKKITSGCTGFGPLRGPHQ